MRSMVVGGGRKRCCNEGAFRSHRPSSRTALARSFDDAADALMRMAIEMAAAAAPTTALRAVPLPRFAGEDR